MRRSVNIPAEIDNRLVLDAKRKNATVGDIIVDAVAYYVGLSVPKEVLRARKVYIHDAEKAKAHKQKSSITRSTRQTNILKALADPEKERMLNQILGLI